MPSKHPKAFDQTHKFLHQPKRREKAISPTSLLAFWLQHNSNTTYLDKNNSKRKFPKFFRNIKGDECENSETMSLIVPNRNLKLIGINNKTLIKDSICDEMIVSNLGTQTIKPSRGDYINELNKKNNGVLNFYLNPELLKKKEDYNALIIEKPIEASNCCVSCT